MPSSPQLYAPMSRLLWKEYRTQRAFWLAMVLFGLVPQVLFRITISRPADHTLAVWIMVQVASALFVIGSTAILFAGEREERTSDWLLNLAVSPLWTLLAKSSFVLMSTLALALTLSITALALVWGVPPLADGAERLTTLGGIVCIFGGLILWGAFGSLVSRRVVTAVPSMGFWWVITMVLPVSWIPWLIGIRMVHAGNQWVVWTLVVLTFVAVAIADAWLGWRWCQGNYLDAQLLSDWNIKLTGWLNRWRGRTTVKSRLPTSIEFDGAGRREWQRLIWQERHRDSFHWSAFVIGCVQAPVFALLGLAWHQNFMPSIFAFVVPMPLVIGVLAFRFDGEGQPLRFLSHRGVSPRLVWIVKQIVWLPRALWIPLVAWLVSCLTEWLIAEMGFFNAPLPLVRVSFLAWSFRGAVLWYAVLSYGCGQLAALVCRRVILAAVVGVALNVVVALWLGMMVLLEVPAWWSVGGLAGWLFLLTWILAPRWLNERRTKSVWPLAVGLLAPPILLIGAVASWRASEIPGFRNESWRGLADTGIRPPALRLHWIESRSDTVRQLKQEIARQSQGISLEDQKVLNRLALSMGGLSTVNDFERAATVGPGGPPGAAVVVEMPEPQPSAVERFWTDNESRLREIMDITKRERAPSASSWLELAPSEDWSTAKGFLPHQQLLLEAGRLRTEEGKLDEALNYYRACLRLASFWATDRGLETRAEAERQRLLTLQQIIAWGNHRDQTSTSLWGAVRRVQMEIKLFPSLRETLVAQYRQDRHLLQDVIQSGWMPDTTNSMAPARTTMFEILRFLPWERFRAERYLEEELVRRDQTVNLLATLLNQPGTDVARSFAESESQVDIADLTRLYVIPDMPRVQGHSRIQRQRYWWTTPLAPMGLADDDVQVSPIQQETVVRESLLALSLLAWKQEHGQWPDSLRELLARDESGQVLPVITAVDPWSGQLFQYRSGESPPDNDDSTWTELLTTAGPRQLRSIIVDTLQEGYGISPHGLSNSVRTWAGEKRDFFSDDRLQLGIFKGTLVLRLPSEARVGITSGTIVDGQ